MLEKLKKVLNKEFSQKIDKAILSQHSFLPVNEQNGVLFVACVAQSPEIDAVIKSNFSSQAKYIPMKKALLSFFSQSHYHLNSPTYICTKETQCSNCQTNLVVQRNKYYDQLYQTLPLLPNTIVCLLS